MHLKLSSAKWRPFCLGLNVLTPEVLWYQMGSNQQWIMWCDLWKCIKIRIMRNLNKQIWGIWKLRPAFHPETPNLGQNRWYFVPCDLEICWMTLENNRASLLCCFKLCATFHSHRWIQTGVTVRKRPIWVKFHDFYICVTLKFDVWPWKTIGHLFYATSGSMHHFVAICDSKLEIQSGNAQFGSKSTIFRSVWPCNLMYDLEKQ